MTLPRRARLGFDRLDRYTLRQFAGPLLAVLVTLLVAQLLERLLRLIDITVSAGAPLSGIVFMAANLVPHYLGLTLPMAFTAAIFMAAARMSDDVEIDVMLATGRSLVRIALPVFVLALLLMPFNLFLFGELQPLSRYGYHLAVDQALRVGWNVKLEENRFVDAGHGMTFSAGAVAGNGLSLQGVFIERSRGGASEITTAARGSFVQGPEGLLLRLEDGRSLRETSDGTIAVDRFDQARVDRDMLPPAPPFRERGATLSERTLPELWRALPTSSDEKPAAEFHGRLARVLILPLLPLLALPLGMASRRGRRTPGIVFAALALVALNHALQFGQSLAASGRASAALAVWTPYALFALLGLWIFRGSLAWPGDNPVLRAVIALEALIDGLKPRRRATAAAR